MISIITAVHNGAEKIRETFQSIYRQTYKDWEIIVVDDGSTDESLRALMGEQRRHPERIRIVRNKKNMGLTKSLIRAEKIAKGEFLARIDIGDMFLPEKLEKQIYFLEKKKEYGLLGCSYLNVYHGPLKKEQVIIASTGNDKIKKTILRKNPFAHSTVLMRREAYLRAGGYDPTVKYGQDYDLWFRMMNVCKMENLAQILCVRILSDDAISFQKQKEQIAQCFKTQLKYMNRWNPAHYMALWWTMVMMLVPGKIIKLIRRRIFLF